MRDRREGHPWLLAIGGSALLTLSVLAMGSERSAGAAPDQDPNTPAQPAPPPSAPPQPAEAAPPGAAPAAAQAAAPAVPPATPAEAPLRIIRVVCTDHICGHCDGKCHKDSGHVAVDKKGHCACTPTEGSALDKATRDSYEKNQPK
jgi:hypothetical protein